MSDSATSERRIVKRSTEAHELPTALAFVFNGQSSDYVHQVTVIQWTEPAYNQLLELRKALRDQRPEVNLPVVSLRGRLEVTDQRNVRLDYALGLVQHRTLLWTATDPETAQTTVNTAILGWLVENVAEYAHNRDAKAALSQVKELARKNLAITATERHTEVFTWNVTPSKTAKATSRTSYADLADFIAHHLEGETVFPDLPPLRRIASGRLDQNQAELMTDPIPVGRSRFSLVVRIRVLSYPGRPTPVMIVEFSKRVWTTGLKEKSRAKTLSAYAFPKDSTRALRFSLRRTKTETGWGYIPDGDFAPIARAYFPKPKFSAAEIVKDGHREAACRLMVVLKHGAGERSEAKSGVPDKDKLDGFIGVQRVMATVGAVPWDGLRYLETSTRGVKDRDQHWSKRGSEDAKHQRKFDTWLAEAQQSIRDVYAGQHHLIIAVQPGHEDDAHEAAQRLKDILKDSVTIMPVPISRLVHGPRATLPDAVKNNAGRAATRIAEWDAFIQIIKNSGRPVDGVLVIARQWYLGNKHDDPVNKRAGRVAIARGLGVPVQYLRPRAEKRDELATKPTRGKKKTRQELEAAIDQDFENRLMIGWLDLAYKSVGRVKAGKLLDEAKSLYHEDSPSLFGAYPDRILALGVVRRNVLQSLHNERSFLPYAIELDVDRGTCSARFAYEGEGQQPVYTSLMRLPDALVTLASLGPVHLSTSRDHRFEELTQRTQAFFKDALSDFGKRALRPLVIVDADTSRSVWPWLKDEEIDPNNVQLAGIFHAEAAWHHARLVRIRTNNSPKVLWDKQTYGVVQGMDGEPTDEEVRYHTPTAAEAELFKVTDTRGTHVYLSFGSTIRTKQTQGRSSYRKLEGMKRIKATETDPQHDVADTLKQHTDAWTTPTGVEIVVLRPGDDKPDHVARLVEWLRQCYMHFGEWTIKPAPLYFERVLKEYIADYDLEDEESADEGASQ